MPAVLFQVLLDCKSFSAELSVERVDLCTRFTESTVDCALYSNASIVNEKLRVTVGLEHKPVKPDTFMDAVCSECPWSASVRS